MEEKEKKSPRDYALEKLTPEQQVEALKHIGDFGYIDPKDPIWFVISLKYDLLQMSLESRQAVEDFPEKINAVSDKVINNIVKEIDNELITFKEKSNERIEAVHNHTDQEIDEIKSRIESAISDVNELNRNVISAVWDVVSKLTDGVNEHVANTFKELDKKHTDDLVNFKKTSTEILNDFQKKADVITTTSTTKISAAEGLLKNIKEAVNNDTTIKNIVEKKIESVVTTSIKNKLISMPMYAFTAGALFAFCLTFSIMTVINRASFSYLNNMEYIVNKIVNNPRPESGIKELTDFVKNNKNASE